LSLFLNLTNHAGDCGNNPPKADKSIVVNGEQKRIKLGPDNYVNRLIAFIEERTTSERFSKIVGSHVEYIGERLDSVFKATQKGSHAKIVNKEEADRYAVYTYLVFGYILSLIRKVGLTLIRPRMSIGNINSNEWHDIIPFDFHHRLHSKPYICVYFRSRVLHQTLIEDQVVAGDSRIPANQIFNLNHSKQFNMF